MLDSSLQHLLLQAVPMILAITLHEAAHGYVARLCGDRTAEMLGRITINPLKHIDPVGTLLVPILFFALARFAGGAGAIFGWAKPVPVNISNLRHPKRDMVFVAAAGPAANFLMAIAWGVVFRLAAVDGPLASDGIEVMARAGIVWNIGLMVLNLLPVPPLDGGRIVTGLLPHRAAAVFARLEPYGFLIIIALLATGMLAVLLRPMERLATRALLGLIGL